MVEEFSYKNTSRLTTMIGQDVDQVRFGAANLSIQVNYISVVSNFLPEVSLADGRVRTLKNNHIDILIGLIGEVVKIVEVEKSKGLSIRTEGGLLIHYNVSSVMDSGIRVVSIFDLSPKEDVLLLKIMGDF